jgi:glycine cleavage system aminomethyltransferase T
MPDARTPVARTPLHPWHAAHGARFIERDGWQVVAGFADARHEAEAARAGLGLADISAFADATAARAGLWLLGPRWEELLCRLTQLDLRLSIPANARVETALAGVEAMLVRSTELAVPSVRVHVAWDVAESVWERMLEAGRDLGITPVGLEALVLLGAPLKAPSVSEGGTNPRRRLV